jgi:hypothetical protein
MCAMLLAVMLAATPTAEARPTVPAVTLSVPQLRHMQTPFATLRFAADPVAPAPATDPKIERWRRHNARTLVAGWTLTGIGAGFAGLGTVIFVTGLGIGDFVGAAFSFVGGVTTVVGLLALTPGLILLTTGKRRERAVADWDEAQASTRGIPVQVALTPVVGPYSNGLGVTGVF